MRWILHDEASIGFEISKKFKFHVVLSLVRIYFYVITETI